MLSALALIALVTFDQAPLRASPRDNAPQQAMLWQGDALEVRGQRADYLQVYDHRRERAGFIKASQVRELNLTEEQAPEYLSVVRFLRDTPGAEAMGISYAAAYLKAAPAKEITPEAWVALGTMAERLAKRATAKHSKQDDVTIGAHLEVVAQLGVTIKSFESDGRVRLCYDGEAFQHVLAMNANSEQKARAVLAMTRQDCIDPKTTPMEMIQLNQWRAELLDKIVTNDLPNYLKNRVQMRRAIVLSAIAFQQARKGDVQAEATENRALKALAGVNKLDFTDEDASTYSDAAVRVGANRWAIEKFPLNNSTLKIITQAGETGQTCALLIDAKHTAENPLIKHCSYGVIWSASARVNPSNNILTLAVQPLEAWRELWIFHKVNDAWIVDVIPPSASDPDLGCLEFAGFVPNTNKILVARDLKIDGKFKQSFDLLNLDTLMTERSADKPESLSSFYRWQDAQWKGTTLILR